MADEFKNRLAAGRAHAVAEKAEEALEKHRVALVKAACDDWQRRILPLLRHVVNDANVEIKGSGIQLAIAGGAAGAPSVSIRAFSESLPVAAGSSSDGLLQLRFGVEDDGTILVRVPHGSAVENHKSILPENFQRKDAEDAVASFVEKQLGSSEASPQRLAPDSRGVSMVSKWDDMTLEERVNWLREKMHETGNLFGMKLDALEARVKALEDAQRKAAERNASV
jgi:hypothetical protein